MICLGAACLVVIGSGTGAGATAAANAPAAPTTAPCNGPDGVGGPVPAGLGPGDLVHAVELTKIPAYAGSPGFPTGTRVWRILYVSTGIDADQLELICGIVAAPAKGPRAFGGAGRMLAWAHGTIGLSQGCLPSSDPAQFVWGKMAGGINAIAWGSGLGKHEGNPSGGALQYAMNQGWLVAMTDYQPNDTYVVGKIAASDVLDSARAATQLMVQQFRSSPSTYNMITWGHSQGGHAAMWAGQLAQSYLAGTHPSKVTPSIRLVGVALEAPATNFVVQPSRQAGVTFGDGLADQEMHQSVGSNVPVLKNLAKLQLQIGPALFSYIFGSWSQLSAQGPIAPGATFPAYPPALAPLTLTAVATPEGIGTIKAVQPLCLTGSDAKMIQKLVSKYHNAATHRMLIAPIWNVPPNYTAGSYVKGGLDRVCATTSAAPLVAWCTWVRWNIPGPLGVNPYPKVPAWNGKPVPVLITQGTDDTIIHCVANGSGTPAPSACTSVTLFNALQHRAYCAGGATQGHLELDLARPIAFRSPASHFSIPGEIAAAGESKSTQDLVFRGSRLQRFMAGAFAGSLPSGCTVGYIN